MVSRRYVNMEGSEWELVKGCGSDTTNLPVLRSIIITIINIIDNNNRSITTISMFSLVLFGDTFSAVRTSER